MSTVVSSFRGNNLLNHTSCVASSSSTPSPPHCSTSSCSTRL
ncbi:hypothetical protein LINPERHAP1_LOCUS17776 [Linum perenne]